MASAGTANITVPADLRSGFYAARTNFADPELDALIDEARVIVDEEERAELYREVGRLGFELAPFLPHPSPIVHIVTRDNVEGVYYQPMYSGLLLWKDIAKN
jgi:peptide/nickel transport system substrate-binding protein